MEKSKSVSNSETTKTKQKTRALYQTQDSQNQKLFDR